MRSDTHQREQHSSDAQRGWEAVPRDGPAVLLVNARMLDDGLGLVGGWLQLDRRRREVVERLGEIVGTFGSWRDYLVVDQIGLGPTMWDEDEVPGLLGLAAETAS